MGGPEPPGVGWAAGIERLSMLCGDPPRARRPVAIIPVGGAVQQQALRLAEDLRRAGFRVDLGYSGNLGKRMRRANKIDAAAAVQIGEDELARHAVTLSDMGTGEQIGRAAGRERVGQYV